MKNAMEVARKWGRNMGSAGPSVIAGVDSVTTSPTELAAQNEAGYLDGVQRAVNSGKWRRGLQRTSLPDWQKAMKEKGVPRMTSAANQAQPKVEAFMNQWLPYEDQLKQKLRSMPRGNLEQNKARMIAAVDHNAAFRRQ